MRLADLTLNKKSGQAVSTCPECSESRKKKREKCLSVNLDTGLYNCHHCGITGILQDYKSDKPMETYTQPSQEVVELTGEAFEYFRSRGITLEVLKANKITVMPEDNRWIRFNYWEDGKIVNIKYRHISEKKFRQSKNGKPIFYGEVKGQRLVICEGEIDKLSFDVIGVDSVSVPMGAPNENDSQVDGKLKCLKLAEDKIHAIPEIILACDNDPNGRRLTEELARRIGIEKCKKVEYPSDCKDANEVLVKYGEDALKRLVDQAKPFPLEGVSKIEDFTDEVFDIYENGYREGLLIGYKDFDEHFKFQTGYLITVTGIPSHGKSNFVEQVAIKLAARHGVKFAIFSPEHYPPEHFIQRLARVYVGKGMFGNDRMTKMELDNAIKFLNEHFYLIHANDEHTLDNILSVAKQLVFREGIRGLIIDPWTDIEHDIERGENETRYVAKALAKIKQFNRMHGVSSFVVAHPTKMQKKEDGSYYVPKLYDISGSANFFNKTDFGLTVYREADDSVTVHVQKVKFQDILGKIGTVQFRFDKPSSRYYEYGTGNTGIEQATQTLTKIQYDDDVPF